MFLQAYLFLHLLGVILTVASLVAICTARAVGATKSEFPWRGMCGAAHGIGLVLLLVSGFGMLARMGMFASLPWWVWTKLTIWVLLGGAVVVAYRATVPARLVVIGVVTLAGAAAYLGATY